MGAMGLQCGVGEIAMGDWEMKQCGVGEIAMGDWEMKEMVDGRVQRFGTDEEA